MTAHELMTGMLPLLDDLAAYIRSGGLVMIPILGVSLVMWVLIFNRVWFMRACM